MFRKTVLYFYDINYFNLNHTYLILFTLALVHFSFFVIYAKKIVKKEFIILVFDLF